MVNDTKATISQGTNRGMEYTTIKTATTTKGNGKTICPTGMAKKFPPTGHIMKEPGGRTKKMGKELCIVLLVKLGKLGGWGP